MAMDALALTGIPLCAYLLGSVPFGLVWTRLFGRADIRKSGSGNIGATNVARVAGVGLGIATLVCDVLKGFLPALLAYRVAPPAIGPEALAAWAALAAVAGHLFPIYTGLKGGGKGVATAGGGFAAVASLSTLAAVVVFLAVFFAFRRVSAASLAAIAVLPAAVAIDTGSLVAAGLALVCAALVFLRHRENIRRLWSGTEPVFTPRRKPDPHRNP